MCKGIYCVLLLILCQPKWNDVEEKNQVKWKCPKVGWGKFRFFLTSFMLGALAGEKSTCISHKIVCFLVKANVSCSSFPFSNESKLLDFFFFFWIWIHFVLFNFFFFILRLPPFFNLSSHHFCFPSLCFSLSLLFSDSLLFFLLVQMHTHTHTHTLLYFLIHTPVSPCFTLIMSLKKF